MNGNKRTIYLISDHTGITVETMGKALLSQFEGLEYDFVYWPFIDNIEKAQKAANLIHTNSLDAPHHPIIFSTLVDPRLRACFNQSGLLTLDFFDIVTQRLEAELERKSAPHLGRQHSMHKGNAYDERMHAVNFALHNDDGVSTKNYAVADIILTGISRSGKTPSCLFLGLQQGILAANYPLTDEDLLRERLPDCLETHRKKLFGLTIDPKQLQRIRQERRPDSRYASLEQCRKEVKLAESLMQDRQVPFLDTTAMSIEEIAVSIIQWIRSR